MIRSGEFFMTKVTIKIDDGVEELEINQHMLDFYKKETGKRKVTEKGLVKFFTNFIQFKKYII
jgi:hypothetical protein